VEFLCERGADVNRGLRSSSLHYAACFGRPQIVKVRSVNCSVVFFEHDLLLVYHGAQTVSVIIEFASARRTTY